MLRGNEFTSRLHDRKDKMVRMQGLGAQRGHVRTGPFMSELTSNAGNQMVCSGGAWQAVSAQCITSMPQPGASLALL